MLIVFEGPDKAGKSTWAQQLDSNGSPRYNLKKGQYNTLKHAASVVAVDRLAWLTHSVYRLALPGYEWNDRAVRTVFAMPDAHLVFMVPSDPHLNTKDELYSKEQSARVQEAYREWCWMLFRLNSLQNGGLFRTISLVEVRAGGTSGRKYELFAINSGGLSGDNFYGDSSTSFNLGEITLNGLMKILKDFE